MQQMTRRSMVGAASALALGVSLGLGLVAGPANASAAPARVAAVKSGSATVYDWVRTSGVRLRTGPGTQYRALGQLYVHDDVEDLSYTSSRAWTRVRLEGRSRGGLASETTGWVSSKYLECGPAKWGQCAVYID